MTNLFQLDKRDKKSVTNLFKHAEEHFATEVAKGRGLVGVDGERVWPDFDIFVTQRLRVDHQLHQRVLLDVRHGIDHLQEHVERNVF